MRARIDAAWWEQGEWDGRPIAEYLARRDVQAAFRFLHARGVSYGAVGSLTGLSPNRVSEIARGARQVTAYDVLERIASGLDIPRAAMGLGLAPAGGPQLPADRAGYPGAPPANVPDIQHGSGVLLVLSQVRIELDEALSAATVSPRQLELIEESVAEHVQLYPRSAPMWMLTRLAGECAEVQRLSRRRQPAAVQARLSGAAALLATMCADALMRLGSTMDARLWYRTAVAAADDSGEARLRVLVRAQAAMLPYYFADAEQTVALAEAALGLSQAPCPSTALASAAKARALARLGDDRTAREAIDHARRLFDQIDEPDSDAAFRFPAKRLLFYLSGAATWLGDTATAYRLQDEALDLYRAGPPSLIDPALIRLDRAICLVHDRRIDEAATTAHAALADLPDTQRTELILTRAQNVVDAVPAAGRPPAVAELDEYVQTCRGQARTLAGGPAPLNP